MSLFSYATGWGYIDGAIIGLYNNGSGWTWIDGTRPTYYNWYQGTNISQNATVMLYYGNDVQFNNTWHTFGLNDGCAAFICQKVLVSKNFVAHQSVRNSTLSKSKRVYKSDF